MHTIVNNRISDDDQNGHINVKISEGLLQQDIDDMERSVLSYLGVLMQLSLTSHKSADHHINDHVPDQGTLQVILESVAEIVNLRIKSRLYDVLQANKKNKFINAKLAIETYFQLLEAENTLSGKRDYLLRIISILKGLGKGNKTLLPIYLGRIVAYISASDIKFECYSITKISKELVGLNLEPGALDLLALKIKDDVEYFKDIHEYRNYRLCHEALAMLLPSDANFHDSQAARSYILDADHFALTPNASQHMIAAKYKKALLRFQWLNITGVEIDSLEKKLSAAKEASSVQGALIGRIDPIEIKDNPHLVLPVFENIYQAVYWLIDFPLIPKKKIIEDMEARKNDFFHLKYIGSVMNNSKGNTIGISEDNSDLIFRDASLMRQIFSKGILNKMYEHFSEHQSISEMEIYEMIARSKFIPQERLSVFARGLFHGFRGNFLESIHILMPQIENNLRFLLNNNGKTTTKLAEELEKEMSLQSVLGYLGDFLHEDLIFELEGLLNEAFGENLRNNIAHGLSDPRVFNEGYIGLYTWWLTLKLSLDIESFFPKATSDSI